MKLVADTTLTGSVEINKSITLDLNGKTIHYTGKNQNTATQTHRALNITSGTVTIKSGTITTTVAGTDYPTEFDAVVVKPVPPLKRATTWCLPSSSVFAV